MALGLLYAHDLPSLWFLALLIVSGTHGVGFKFGQKVVAGKYHNICTT